MNRNDILNIILENNYSGKADGETNQIVNEQLIKIKELVIKEIK
jgi:hypothetical protein